MTVENDLIKLGSTADEVADSLRAAGVKGTLFDCPITVWYEKKHPSRHATTTRSIIKTGPKTWPDSRFYDRDYELPQPVRDFVRAVDEHRDAYEEVRGGWAPWEDPA